MTLRSHTLTRLLAVPLALRVAALWTASVSAATAAKGGGAGQHDADGDGTPDPVTLTDSEPDATGVDVVLRKKGG